MVSQPNHPPSSTLLTVGHRGAKSVVTSRPHASSRSKRYNRSHVGGAQYIPQNEFPVFSHSGDVEILIRAGGRENRYLLHRHTLIRCSGFFEASTSQEWSKAVVLPSLPAPPSNELTRIGEDGGVCLGSNMTNNGTENMNANGNGNEVARMGAGSPGPPPRRRWRYELDQGLGGDDIPMLIQKEANTSSSSIQTQPTKSIFGGGTPNANTSSARHKQSQSATHTTSSFFRSVANLSLAATHHHPTNINPPPYENNMTLLQANADLLRDYDNLFRIFYNYPPLLDGINIADAYVQCKSLLTLADQYDALAVTGPRVDHHLLQFQSRLWKQIAKYPVSYLRLGYLARSKVIFQEALIHVVGQWPAGERSIRSALPEIVLDIIEDKVDELEETVSRVEGKLFRLSLTDSRGERVTPASSYLDWLAVSFFRQWLGDNTCPQPPAPPSSSHRNDRQRAPPSAPAPATAPLASVGRTYRLLGSPHPTAYLTHDECKRFLKLTPDLYSRDNLRRFEKGMNELKGMARELVRPLMGSSLELELSGTGGGASKETATASPVGYLTCVRVVERDLPWSVED